jgi:di/tripeptidase
MDVDIRSMSLREIDRIEAYLQTAVDSAVREENARRATSGTRLQFAIERLGERPTGETSANAEIVRVAVESSRVFGIEPQLECASTDANIPISLGIPAITIGAGGNAGNPHTLDEWYDATNREVGIKRALLLVLALAGIPGA